MIKKRILGRLRVPPVEYHCLKQYKWYKIANYYFLDFLNRCVNSVLGSEYTLLSLILKRLRD
jgi:hypothetical protein